MSDTSKINNLAVAGAIAALMAERSGAINEGEWYQLQLYFRVEPDGSVTFERTDLRPGAPDATTQIPPSIPFTTLDPPET